MWSWIKLLLCCLCLFWRSTERKNLDKRLTFRWSFLSGSQSQSHSAVTPSNVSSRFHMPRSQHSAAWADPWATNGKKQICFTQQVKLHPPHLISLSLEVVYLLSLLIHRRSRNPFSFSASSLSQHCTEVGSGFTPTAVQNIKPRRSTESQLVLINNLFSVVWGNIINAL